MGMSDKSCLRFKDKELYGLDMINGHHQPRDWKPTQRIGEAGVNPRCGD